MNVISHAMWTNVNYRHKYIIMYIIIHVCWLPSVHFICYVTINCLQPLGKLIFVECLKPVFTKMFSHITQIIFAVGPMDE